MKTMLIGTAALAALLAFSQRPAAARERSDREIQLLNDSASVLADVNPALCEQVKAFMVKQIVDDGVESGDEARDIKMLRDSADALKPKRPDLARGLRRFAAKEERARRGG